MNYYFTAHKVTVFLVIMSSRCDFVRIKQIKLMWDNRKEDNGELLWRYLVCVLVKGKCRLD